MMSQTICGDEVIESLCLLFIFSPNASPLKTMKNAFYFI